MTDSIDLDEMDVGEGEDEDDETATYGDWLWQGEGDPENESDPVWGDTSSEATTDDDAESDDEDDSDDAETSRRVPQVPGATEGPVGVPEERGGGGAGGSSSAASETEPAEPESADSTPRTTDHGEATSADDMTLAFTYQAINRLEDPQFVIGDARGWADWIGIVGTVSTPAIRKFQRDERIDLDFLGGSETGPAERLADVTPDSMFYADRMVVVGADDEAWIADEAGWEFVPLATAAEKADWTIEHPE